MHSLNVERHRAPYSINSDRQRGVQQTADHVDDKESLNTFEWVRKIKVSLIIIVKPKITINIEYSNNAMDVIA